MLHAAGRAILSRLRLAVAGIVLLVSATAAAGTSYDAGIVRTSVPADPPFGLLVWYPARGAAQSWTVGPFDLPAGHGAAPADGRFPIVLLSHGGGPGGGSPLILAGLSAALARAGFVVVAPLHQRAALPRRVVQLNRALDAVLADRRFAGHVDPLRIGLLGFSLGGAVALEAAGAIPDAGHFAAYCGAHPEDVMSCAHAPDGRPTGQPSGREIIDPGRPAPPLPARALVLLDPFAAPFQRDGLAALGAPVLLLRPSASELPAEANAFALAAALPQAPEFDRIAGGHFVFADPCVPAVAAEAPEICRDPPGVDRRAVQTATWLRIVDFLRATL